MSKVKIPTISDLVQACDGPISGDMRLAILKIGELVSLLPQSKVLQGREAVISLADCCVRVHGLEEVAVVNPEGAA